MQGKKKKKKKEGKKKNVVPETYEETEMTQTHYKPQSYNAEGGVSTNGMMNRGVNNRI
jgi:hypothetical protein